MIFLIGTSERFYNLAVKSTDLAYAGKVGEVYGFEITGDCLRAKAFLGISVRYQEQINWRQEQL